MDNCPSDLCECDDDDNTEQIDYDPIQRANEPTPVAEPAQALVPVQAPAPTPVPVQAALPDQAPASGQAPAPQQVPASMKAPAVKARDPHEAAAQAASEAARAQAPEDPSVSMTGEAGHAHLALSALGGLDMVSKACTQAFTGRGNPHAGHAPGALSSLARE